MVKGVVFESGSVGRKEIQCTWNSLKDYVRLEVVAGPPTQVKVLDYDTDEVRLTVFTIDIELKKNIYI